VVLPNLVFFFFFFCLKFYDFISGLSIYTRTVEVKIWKKPKTKRNEGVYEKHTIKGAFVNILQLLALIYDIFGKDAPGLRLHFTSDGSPMRNGAPRTTISIVVEVSDSTLKKMNEKEKEKLVCFIFM
jgi:hypothetical protein